jgi:hypothetical protein
MGVPIGDVARVSQVLLAQLQQSRDTSSGRTGVSGVLSQDSLSTAQIQSSGNVESIDGFFKGDGGLLSNVVVGLQRVTEVGNITDNTLININKTRSQVNYSPCVLQGLILPQYVARANETGYNLGGYTAIASDSAGTTIVLTYGNYFRTLRIDPNDKRIILSSFDVSDSEQFGNYAKLSNNGLRLLLKTSYGRVKLYNRWSTAVQWEFSGSIYDNNNDAGAGPFNSNIGFGASIDADDNLTVVVVGCPHFDKVYYPNYNTAVFEFEDWGMVKIYSVGNSGKTISFNGERQAPIEARQFGRNVAVSRDGSKVIVNNYIYDLVSWGLIRTIGRESGNMKISNDGTVAIIDDKLHKYIDPTVGWTYDILSGVTDITSSNATFKASGIDIIKYEYYAGSEWTSSTAYSHLNSDDIIHISENGSTIITSNDNTLSIVDILDGDGFSVGDMNASKYYGDGGTLSNILVGNDIFMSSVNYNSANVYGSNTFNLHVTDTVTTPSGATLMATNSTATRVVVTHSRSIILPYIYDYDGTNWVNTTQLTSSLFPSSPGSSIFDLDISGDGQTIILVDGYYLYVWKYNGSIWIETRYDTGGEGAYYCKVSEDGNVILACNQRNGGPYDGLIYSFINGSYTGTFKPSSTQTNDRLVLVKMNYDGTKVMLYDNDWTGTNQGNGRVYIFTRNGTSWSQEHQVNVGPGVAAYTSINQDFTVFSYSSGPLYIYEYKDNTWTRNPYVGPSGLGVRSINRSGTQILAAAYPGSSRYIIYNNNGNWEHKSVANLVTRRIESAGVSTFIYSSGVSFEVAEVISDTTLNIDATDVNISGNIVTDKVTANYFVGDGSTLTGIPTTIDDHLNLSGASGGQVLTWNGSHYAWTVNGSGGLDTSQTLGLTNVTTGLAVTSNALVTGNVTADYFVGDGSNLTGISDGIDTTQTLALSNVRTGLFVTSNAMITGNVTADYFVGDGSQLTGVGIDTTQTLALSNVTTGLTVTSNAVVTGNVTADYFVGDGGLLSNIESQRVYVLTTNGSSDYVFQGPGFDTPTNDPVLRLIRGFTYIFDNRSNYPIHPFKIRNNYNGNDFIRGVINDGAGMTTFTVPMDAPSSLYYQCSVHSSMGNIIHILSEDIDTTQTLALSNVTTGLTVTSNAIVQGNVTANYFVGDGSQLTGVGIDTTQTLALSNVTTGLTVSSTAIIKGDLKLLGSMYHNDDIVMNTVFGSTWTQLGDDIDGEAGGDQSGYSVSLSADGTRVAIGAPYNDNVNGSNSGHTRVYELSGGVWTQLGGDIDGEAADDQSGTSVSLSADGTRVAIGATQNDANVIDGRFNGSNSGHTRVYAWSGGAWTQLGGDIDGEAAFDQSGRGVSLSADGTRVAIGATQNDSSKGHTRVYEWSGGAWTQLGGDIDGEAAFDNSGYSVFLSADGTRVAIGAYANDGNGGNSGHTRVYAWSGGAWTQLGDDIDGEAEGDHSGYSVSLSADGTCVAIGAVYNNGKGHTRVYTLSGGAWTQLGDDIDGEAGGDNSGHSVSLSADGTRVAIGATGNDGVNGGDSGHTRVYEWSGGVWTQLGDDIDGEAAGDRSGFGVSLSADGTSVAIGAIGNNGFKGHTRVYGLPSYKAINTDKLFATSNIGIGTTTPVYALDVVGDIYASGTITQSSDIRKKSNLHVISEPVDKLNQIHGYTYDMDGKRRTGLVAQEVLEVLPEAVVGSEENGYGLAYGDTIGLLVEAIKELNRLRHKDNERIKNLEYKMSI